MPPNSVNSARRYGFLAIAVLLHVLAFFALYHLVIFSAPPAPIEDTQIFQQIKIAPRPITPPTPPPVTLPTIPLPNFQPSSAGASQAASSPAAAVTAITMPNVTPSINESANTAMVALSRLPTTDTNPVTTSANGTANTGDTAENGNGEGNADSGAGRGPIGAIGVGANHIPEKEKLAIILDDSSSVTDTHANDRILQTKSTTYPNAIYIGAPNAGGHYIPNPKNDTEIAASTTLANLPSPLNAIPRDAESKDLYAGIYIAIHRGMTSVLLVSDFQNNGYPDVRTDAATTNVIAAMRAAHIKLYILTIQLDPPQTLSDYAEESGGNSSDYRK